MLVALPEAGEDLHNDRVADHLEVAQGGVVEVGVLNETVLSLRGCIDL